MGRLTGDRGREARWDLEYLLLRSGVHILLGDLDAAAADIDEAASVELSDGTQCALLLAYRTYLRLARRQITPEEARLAVDPIRQNTMDLPLSALLARISSFEGEPPAPLGHRPPVLVVREDGQHFTWPMGAPALDLGRRGPMKRILAHLARRREERPGEGIDAMALFDVGWPGERALPEAALHRVYVTLARLRKLGLGDLIVTRDDGYLLSTDVEVERVPA